MKTKTFDTVEMKRLGASKIHEATKEMTQEEKLEYWKKRTEALRKQKEAAR